MITLSKKDTRCELCDRKILSGEVVVLVDRMDIAVHPECALQAHRSEMEAQFSTMQETLNREVAKLKPEPQPEQTEAKAIGKTFEELFTTQDAIRLKGLGVKL